MKIYQLIYTSVKHSLQDTTLGLINEPGYRVYSCSQGLTADEINEIIRFCGYRLPKNNEITYSNVPFDPNVPEKFPKTFRTFRLDSGKYVAIQVVYSGYDWTGEEGNFFAHAFIIDDVPNDFRPEIFYGSKSFKTYLTEEEANIELVRYLPKLEEPQYFRELSQKVNGFVTNHKIQMSSILEQAMAVFAEGEKTHICICGKNSEESDMYVLGLKRILPLGMSAEIGVSTNNIFLPSNNQNKVIINGTISGRNNILPENIENRTNCVYIDTQRIETDGVKPLKLFEMSMDELYKSYDDFSITNGKQLGLWLNSFERLTEEGVGKRLRELYDSVGEKLFVQRANTLFETINEAKMQQVKFEILEVMQEHIELFPEKENEIVGMLMSEGIACICSGGSKNIESIFRDITTDEALMLYSKLDEYMTLVDPEKIDFKSGTLLLRVLSLLKNACDINTWKSFFKDNYDYLCDFVEICAKVMINDTSPVTFTAPAVWTPNDMAEVIAMFDSSTEDNAINKACRKYFFDNKNAPWREYGITIKKIKKTKEESDRDIMHIKKLLTMVGYVPFQRSTYNDLKFDVTNEMAVNEVPLLLIRLLNSIFVWQSCDGVVTEAEKAANNAAALILEMKQLQPSCYNFVFPKLAIEVLDSPGSYHEIIINDETMSEDFWMWFLIALRKNIHNEEIRLNYERVFRASEDYISSLPIYGKLRKIFKD